MVSLGNVFQGWKTEFCTVADSVENFTAEFAASAPMCNKPPPMSPELVHTTSAGEGVKVSVANFQSSNGHA